MSPHYLLFLIALMFGLPHKDVQAQGPLELLTYGDSITAGFIETTDGGASSNCAPGVSLDESLSGSGNLRCFGYGAEGVGGYQPELKQSLESLGYEVSIYNWGYSGIATGSMRSLIGAVVSQEPSSDYVLLMGGANDAFDGISASTVKSNLQSMVNTICARGMIPVLATVTENHISSTYNSRVTSYNSEIREIDSASSDCAVLSADQYIALGSRSDFGSDGLHLSSQGNSKMAGEWFSALGFLNSSNIAAYVPIIFMLLDD